MQACARSRSRNPRAHHCKQTAQALGLLSTSEHNAISFYFAPVSHPPFHYLLLSPSFFLRSLNVARKKAHPPTFHPHTFSEFLLVRVCLKFSRSLFSLSLLRSDSSMPESCRISIDFVVLLIYRFIIAIIPWKVTSKSFAKWNLLKRRVWSLRWEFVYRSY